MMTNNCIDIIIMVANKEEVKEKIKYIKALNVPLGYEMNIVVIEKNQNVAAAYNKVMKTSKAKYKIYLNGNAVIVNENFLNEIISIFTANDKIGIIGLLGNKVIPTNGICESAVRRVGKVLSYKGEKYNDGLNNITGDYLEVLAVDDICMATQYDLPWREDLFFNRGFYDTAQCIEFRRRGYKVVVKNQKDFEMVCDWNSRDKFYPLDARNRFLDEYSKDIYPLVSVIIPTYNRPKYFRKCLESILAQSYRNLDIFITDNSSNSDTAEMMVDYVNNDPRIKYEHHPEFPKGSANGRYARSYNNPKAEYLNLVMDDDVLKPDKIAKMMDVYLSYDNISLVTSYRESIDEKDNIITDLYISRPMKDRNSIIDGQSAGVYILKNCINFIGEPTTTLIKKKCLRNGEFCFTGTEGDDLIVDFPTWLYCLQKGNLYYFREPLSQFRRHDEQSINEYPIFLRCVTCWGICIEYAYRQKIFLKNFSDYQKALSSWLRIYNSCVEYMKEKEILSHKETQLHKLAMRLISMEIDE